MANRHFRFWAILSFAGAFACPWPATTHAAPKPSVTPKSWQVDITFHDPQRIAVQHPGDPEPTVYWYVLFTVTNNSNRDVPFYPTFDIVTDDLSVIEGGDSISPSVYDAIAARHRKGYPFFLPPSRIYGTLLQGEDNARISAIAFRRPDPKVNQFTLYIGGLSGEIVRVRKKPIRG